MKFFLQPLLPVLLLLGLGSSAAEAQVRVQVNVGAPAWGPPVPAGVQYYYIPEIDGYYDLYARSYVYFDPYYNTWVSAPALPAAYYAGYDPRYFHPVVVQYVGRQPWGLIYDHRSYCHSRGWRPGYYRSAPGPRWPGGYGGYGYRNQADRYDNRSYAQDNRGGFQGGGYQSGRYDQDDRRDRGGYDGRRNGPGGYDGRGNYSGRPEYGQAQPGYGQGSYGGNGGNSNSNNGGGRGRVR